VTATVELLVAAMIEEGKCGLHLTRVIGVISKFIEIDHLFIRLNIDLGT